MQLIAGLVMGLAAVLLVLEPLLRAATGSQVSAPQPLFSDSDDEDDPLLARRDRALAALKEIEFDRATGKLSDDDFGKLKAQFTEEALVALREADAATATDAPSALSHLPATAPADDVEKLIESARRGGNGGKTLKFCFECGAALAGRRRFCTSCGAVLKPR